jgi:hypothetical protein
VYTAVLQNVKLTSDCIQLSRRWVFENESTMHRLLFLYYVVNALKTGVFVNIATCYGLNGQGLIPVRDKKLFSTAQLPDHLWSSPSLLFIGYWGPISWEGVKQLELEADHSH